MVGGDEVVTDCGGVGGEDQGLEVYAGLGKGQQTAGCGEVGEDLEEELGWEDGEAVDRTEAGSYC